MILLRHGETPFNVVYGAVRRDPGIRDPALTDTGRAQAGAAADRLRAEGLTRLIASPYRRTVETADIIAGALGIPVTIEPLVRERAAFVCDIGTPAGALARHWRQYDFSRLEERWWTEPEESESALLGRCADFSGRMRASGDWRTVAVVSHWGFIRGLTRQPIKPGQQIRFQPD